MKALTLRLDDDVYEALRVEAFEKRTTISDLIRAALRRQGPITDANPQAWQYGVLGGFPESVMGPMSSRASAEGLCGGDPTRLMRRRPGVAPGPWEPVEAARAES